MLFIPIDVYLWNRSFILTSGLNHVAWFHFTLFSFQRTISAALFSDSFIISHRFISVKNFLILFWSFSVKTSTTACQSRLGVVFVPAVSLSDLYYDTRSFIFCQHFFVKNGETLFSASPFYSLLSPFLDTASFRFGISFMCFSLLLLSRLFPYQR